MKGLVDERDHDERPRALACGRGGAGAGAGVSDEGRRGVWSFRRSRAVRRISLPPRRPGEEGERRACDPFCEQPDVSQSLVDGRGGGGWRQRCEAEQRRGQAEGPRRRPARPRGA